MRYQRASVTSYVRKFLSPNYMNRPMFKYSNLSPAMNKNLQALVHRWRKCITNGGDYVEK